MYEATNPAAGEIEPRSRNTYADYDCEEDDLRSCHARGGGGGGGGGPPGGASGFSSSGGSIIVILLSLAFRITLTHAHLRLPHVHADTTPLELVGENGKAGTFVLP